MPFRRMRDLFSFLVMCTNRLILELKHQTCLTTSELPVVPIGLVIKTSLALDKIELSPLVQLLHLRSTQRTPIHLDFIQTTVKVTTTIFRAQTEPFAPFVPDRPFRNFRFQLNTVQIQRNHATGLIERTSHMMPTAIEQRGR